MTAHAYTENQLVEQPAIGLFAGMGWCIAFGSHLQAGTLAAGEQTAVVIDESGLFGRETKGEVVLTDRLRAALVKLNPDLPAAAIDAAIDEIVRDRSAMGTVNANREIYELIKNGVKLSLAAPRKAGLPQADKFMAGQNGSAKPADEQTTVRVKIIDWECPAANDFLLISQFSVVGSLYTCRPDLVGFVNGLPWIVIELKKPAIPAYAAFEGNLSHYKQQIPQLFWYNAFLIASNGTDSRVGSLTADWGRFFEWKRIAREDEPRSVSLEVILRGTCDKARLFDLVENFTLFSEHKAGTVKIIPQNHQFLGVNNAISSMQEARGLGHGRGGVFWQTQGSGKSFSMVFFAQKVLRKLIGNWSFVIVTDRSELDEQIARTFKNAGAVSEAEGDICHAESSSHLRELLRGNHRYIFTLIHKFRPEQGSGEFRMPVLSDKEDVIVIVDEAHRSQYDTLALNMRTALPNALFLAFTGTPLIAGEERTREVFGDYVSIYDFQQSVEDGATVPLFYENRTPELQLINPDLNEDIYSLIEDAALDAAQEEKLEKVLGRQYHLITRDDRLDTVAADIVQHFLGRGFIGKAMVVSIDKATALRMYNKVKRNWEAETALAHTELRKLAYRAGDTLSPDEQQQLEAQRNMLEQRLEVLQGTDMALVVSPGQNEIGQMKSLGLDIESHRKRMNESQPGLDEKFKDPADPLRMVFVCAMWLTGFDVPSCSTIYLDKPMRNHTLMQTIARANRVFPGKHSGMIVDYANVFASLEKALAIYGAGKDSNTPVRDKAELAAELQAAVEAATDFCRTHSVNLSALEALPTGSMAKLESFAGAVDALINPDNLRREFFAHEKLVVTLYRAVKPDPAAIEYAERISGLVTLAAAIRIKLNPDPPDIETILRQISTVLDNSIAGIKIRDAELPVIDLSKIDFEALARRFKKSRYKKTDLEELKAAIRARLERLVRLNRTRINFAEKFEELIESYNNGSRNIEQLFAELLKLSKSLDQEEERHIRENLTEEELVIFDILTRPAPDLSTAERNEVKKVARELLVRIKALLVLNWRKKSAARSKLRLAIEDTLDNLPLGYDRLLYAQKCSILFEHVYESYPERNSGVYAEIM